MTRDTNSSAPCLLHDGRGSTRAHCAAWLRACAWLALTGGAGALWPQLVSRLEELVSSDVQMPPSYPVGDGEEFDYIVVGAGAAGSALAARLALAGQSVVLLEAGGDPDLLSTIPSAAMGLLGSPLDWHYETVPNNVSCLGLEGGQCRFSRGKCLGGSTSINYMLYVRGNRRDYNLGVPGWTWDELQSYFLRYEGLQDLARLPPSSARYHNTSGIVRTSFFADSGNSWHSTIIEGFQSLNFPFNPDVNAESQIGVTQLVGYKGERMSTARAYLADPEVKRRLKVSKRAHCTGVILDEDNVARGVTAVRGGDTLRLRARREVVLSAGAIGSPQLLMVSGVGPAAHLRALDIPVRADLPVGDDMSDHVLPLVFITEKSLRGEWAELTGAVANAVQYGITRDGPFASNGLTDVGVFANTRCYDAETRQLLYNDTDCELPTLQLVHAYLNRGLVTIARSIVQHSMGLNSDIIEQLSEANAKSALVIASLVVLSPHSRGTVRLASTDPLAPPAIFPNYLGDTRDVQEMLRALAVLRHAVASPAYRRRGAELLRLRLPGCDYDAPDDAYWACYVRHLTYSVYHSAGTAALGRVLDARLRVRGVRGLRVADLSALPRVPRGNTAAIAIAIGERAADFLLEDNQ